MTMSSTKLFFGGLIAFVLLVLYVYLVWSAISVVTNANPASVMSEFTKPMASTLALIGGLVSALVIVELAITKPGDAPVARAITATDSTGYKTFVRFVVFGYLVVWIITGLAALLISLRKPDVLQPLTDLGQTWLGLAVAAGYAYFGITPR
jgi:hypothetical protein